MRTYLKWMEWGMAWDGWAMCGDGVSYVEILNLTWDSEFTSLLSAWSLHTPGVVVPVSCVYLSFLGAAILQPQPMWPMVTTVIAKLNFFSLLIRRIRRQTSWKSRPSNQQERGEMETNRCPCWWHRNSWHFWQITVFISFSLSSPNTQSKHLSWHLLPVPKPPTITTIYSTTLPACECVMCVFW